MVEVEAGQEDLNCTATDSLVKRHGHWRADSLQKLCQGHTKDIPLLIDVQQLIILTEINLQTEIVSPDADYKERYPTLMYTSMVQFT